MVFPTPVRPSAIHRALIGFWLLRNALEDMADNVHTGPCTCQPKRHRGCCPYCESQEAAEDAGGQLYGLRVFESIIEAAATACPEPAVKLRAYLEDNYLDVDAGQLADVLLQLGKGADEADADAPVFAGRGD